MEKFEGSKEFAMFEARKKLEKKSSERLEFNFVCPHCGNEEGCYDMDQLRYFEVDNICGNCGEVYPICMRYIQYCIKEEKETS